MRYLSLVFCHVACLLAGVAALADEPQATVRAAEPTASANPYGFETLWAQGDLVARATLLILLLMSMASWYVLLAKLLDQHRMFRQAKAVERHFWPAATMDDGMKALPTHSPFLVIAAAGRKSVDNYRGMTQDVVDLSSWAGMSIQRAVGKFTVGLQTGITVLATVGSTAPFVGLFGTVWGIYHALTAIGAAGQASIDKVAGPVGEALIMTAIGLAVAVPAVLGYNWLVHRNKVLIDTLRAFGSDIHSQVIGEHAAARPLGDRQP